MQINEIERTEMNMEVERKAKEWRWAENDEDGRLIVGWFLCLMAYQLFLGYLMPKPFS